MQKKEKTLLHELEAPPHAVNNLPEGSSGPPDHAAWCPPPPCTVNNDQMQERTTTVEKTCEFVPRPQQRTIAKWQWDLIYGCRCQTLDHR